jgi:serine protease AprX
MALSRVSFRSRSLISLCCLLLASALLAVAHFAGSGDSSVFSWSSASAAGPAAQASTGAPSALGSGLAGLARRQPSRVVQVIVQLRGDGAAARAAVAAAGGRIDQPLPIIGGFAASLPARSAVTLARLSDVRVVSLNAEIKGTGFADTSTSNLVSAYDQSIHANWAWDQGVTGSGVGVAVIDTGVAGNLPDFQVSPSDSSSRVIVSGVVNPAATDATDSYGHGTHVAGIIAGDSWNRGTTDPDGGKYVGVAPDANIISVKADDGHGHATVLDLIDGLQFVVDHASQYNIRVVNLSVRSTVAQSYTTDPLDAAVEQAWLKGIVVVAAAGNLGASSDAVSYAPANDPYVITVGAVDDQGTPGTGDDALASWSSRGVTQDGLVKPDVLAPGAHIVSTLAPNSDYASECPSCIVDGNYLRIGGTSMAAAVVSGAVADILSANPSWTPDQVKGSLINRTRPVLKSTTSTGTFVNADGTVEPSGTTSTSTVRQGEIALDKVLSIAGGAPAAPADQNLTPNQFVDPATGNIIDQTGSWATGSWGTGSWGTGSWSAGTWAAATGNYVAPWASASYTGAPLSPTGFSAVPPDCIQLQRTYFSTGSWATGSWSSDQLSAALSACSAAAAQAGSWGTGSWGTGSWGTGSWGTGSWGTGSWGTGSWGTGSWGTGSWSTGSWATSFNN